MNRRIRKTGVLFLTLAGLFLAGCSLPNSNANTTIAVDDEGVLTETIAEECDGESFSEDDLKEYIRRNIEKYTSDGGSADAVKMESCEVTDQAARVVMTFASVDDYSKFNRMPCFLGTLKQAEEAGYDVDQNYLDPSGKEGDKQTIRERRNEWKVFIVSEPVYVRVPDKILYATDNVQVTGRMTARVLSVIGDSETTDENAVAGASDSISSASAELRVEDGSQTIAESVESGSEPAAGTAETNTESEGDGSAFASVADQYAYIIYK